MYTYTIQARVHDVPAVSEMTVVIVKERAELARHGIGSRQGTAI